MNINETLLDNCKPHLDRYGCNELELIEFFREKNRIKKQDKAISIIKGILNNNNKKPLVNLIIELANIEFGIKQLQPKARDHVVHALFTYLLGIYINEKVMIKNGYAVDIFQWKIASLFHDISYPIQLANDIIKSYAEKINNIGGIYHETFDNIFFKLVCNKIDKLLKISYKKRLNSFDLFHKWLRKWNIKINPEEHYNFIINKGEICHGMLSALTIIFLIDLMYQKNNPRRVEDDISIRGSDGIFSNWNEKYFEGDIAPACAAIFIHNLDKILFLDNRIDPKKAPLAFLLRLCDSLQEWERPLKKKPYGERADKFDIGLTPSNHLIYYANINKKHINKIEGDIKSVLATMDYFIIIKIKDHS